MEILFEAARKRDPSQLLELLQSRHDNETLMSVSLAEPHILHPIFAVRSVEGMRSLLDCGTPPNLSAFGMNPLCCVFDKDSPHAMVELLLSRGADPFLSSDHRGWNAFDQCMRKGSAQELSILLKYYPERGRQYVIENSRRVLDNYRMGSFRSLLEYLKREMPNEPLVPFTAQGVLQALESAEVDRDFYPSLALLLHFNDDRVLDAVLPSFTDIHKASLVKDLAEHWRFKLHLFFPVSIRERVFHVLLCLAPYHFDRNVRACLIRAYVIQEAALFVASHPVLKDDDEDSSSGTEEDSD